MSDLSIKGKIVNRLDLVTGTSKAGKEWQKRDFVIETFGQFPSKVCFTLFGDKVNLLDNILLDDIITVHFNVESREYNGKWYHNINAWKIDCDEKSQSTYTQPAPAPTPQEEKENNDDLPF